MTIAPLTPSATAEALNRATRRVFQAGRQPEWSSAVVDAALGFCERAALFTIQGTRLRLERASFEIAEEVTLARGEAPAVEQALQSLEPVASAWSARELSEAIVSSFGAPNVGRAFLFPVAAAGKAVGLLVAVSPDPNGLELVAMIAGAAWELRRGRNESSAVPSDQLISLAPAAASPDDSEHHQRARRFASVRVAELRLYQAAKVREGREAKNLYDVFREEIDHERSTFTAQFLEKSASMVDYLHEELVRTLAQGEPDRMGENYPGAMVRR